MARTQAPRNRLGTLKITDADVDAISFTVINDSGAEQGQVMQWDEDLEQWVPVSLTQGSTFVDNEVPAGVVDNVNTVFTLAYPPLPPVSLQLFVGGLLMAQGVDKDYTVNNQTITFLTPPQVNDNIVAFYRR